MYLVWSIVFSLALYAAYCIPAGRSVIEHVDLWTAYAFNSIVGHSPTVDKILAFLCTKYGDVCVLGTIVTVFAVQSLRGTTLKEAAKRLNFWFWVGLWCVAAYLITCVISDDFLPRPTPVTQLHLSNVQELYGIKLRSSALHSYPSGHCLAYMMFAIASIKRYPRTSLLIAGLGLLTMALRLSLGLHWLSDILMGSLPLTLLVLSVAELKVFDGIRAKIEGVIEFVLKQLASRGVPFLADKAPF
jgi:membrane-associated phospholipid phosphatase